MTKQDIANARMKVKDLTVVRNRKDAVSVDMFMNELQKEPYNPVLLYKQQHDSSPSYPSLPKECFVFAMQSFRRTAINSMLLKSCAWMLPTVPMLMDSS